MPSSLQINPTPSGMEKPPGLEGSFLGQGWRLRKAKEEDFSSHQRRKQRCPSQSGLGLIFAPLSSAHIQAGSLRLQEDPPVQRAHWTCNQTEAKGLRARGSPKNKAAQSPDSLCQQGQSGSARGSQRGNSLGDRSTTRFSLNCLFCLMCWFWNQILT